MKVNTDLYTKVVLTVIALCLLFDFLKDMRIIPDIHAQTPSVINTAPVIAPVESKLRTNEDGSINVRLVAADVMEIKPAYGATFRIEPSSSSTKFAVEPAPYTSNSFKVEPTSSAVFAVKSASNSSFKVEPAWNKSFEVKPASGAIFTVKEQTTSSVVEEEYFPTLNVYPNPAQSELYIEYDYLPDNAKHLLVYNLNGELMEKILVDSGANKHVLNVSNYNEGIYLYVLGKLSGKFMVK